MGLALPKAVIDGASAIMPAMARFAVSETAPFLSIWFTPFFMRRMWMCSPDPALPTVIFGANGKGAHAQDERVSVRSLFEYTQMFTGYLKAQSKRR